MWSYRVEHPHHEAFKVAIESCNINLVVLVKHFASHHMHLKLYIQRIRTQLVVTNICGLKSNINYFLPLSKPYMKQYKLMEENFRPLIPSLPPIALVTNLRVITLIIRMVWLNKTIGMLWKQVSLSLHMLIFLYNFGIMFF
ncbi:hypothetical protein CR513_45633, partial [Mucuna pruriens]